MKYKINNYLTKRLFAFLLVLFLIIPTLSACAPNITGGNNNVGMEGELTTLEIVSLEETTREEMGWTQVANAVMPSIVAITSYNDNTGSTGTGSGIIISENGYIITNAHVIDDKTNTLTVILPDETPLTAEDNERYEATLIGMDTYTDLAVIKIDAENLTVAEFANSEEIEIAQGVMAVGFPGGLGISPSATVTIGYISSVARPIDMGNGYVINSIQTDAAINPGNSGGALVNDYGQVVGIPTSKIAAFAYEGLGFAIPSSVAQVIVNDLIEFGYVTNRATIGVGGVVYDENNANFYDVPVGILVQEIFAQNTLDSGLLVGDRITKVEGEIVNSINIINFYLQQKLPGETLLIEVFRNNTYFELTILLSDFNEVYGD
jgi:serine protease Do